ncbi:MAG: GNAT family N-acetyltransferase [Planctomycetota bacterium]|nr:GNAT family N-acetyltransferase [Planctomycetota bacterium]
MQTAQPALKSQAKTAQLARDSANSAGSRHASGLDCHPANSAETRAAFANVFEFWPMAETVEEHVERRSNSPQHQFAEWFVGTLQGDVVVSLGCYPQRFRFGETEVDGFAIAAVHTRPDARGCGHAPRLIDWVERYYVERGRSVGLLYSDIRPEYYARLGYIERPSFQGTRDIDVFSSAKPQTTGLSVVEFLVAEELDALISFYSACTRGDSFSILRDEAYWRFLIQRSSVDIHTWFGNDNGDVVGYARLHPQHAESSADEWQLVDFVVHPQHSHLEADVHDAIFREASRQQIRRVSGWLPDSPVIRSRYAVEARSKGITMIKALDGGAADVTDRKHNCTDWIREIDHV